MLNYSEDNCSLFGRGIIAPENAKELDTLQPAFVTTIIIIQLAISASGTVGNIISLVVLVTNKSLQTIPNLYIGVLAAVDLIVCMLIPVSTVQLLSGRIPHIICKIIGYVITMNLTASFTCMMLIAVNRYVLIIKGKAAYKKWCSRKKSIISLLLVWLWLLLVIVVVPEASKFALFGFNEKFGTCVVISYCFKNYIYVCVVLSALVFLPAAIVTAWAYLRIVRKLIKIRKRIERNNHLVRPKSTVTETDLDAERKTSRVEKEYAKVVVDDDEDNFDFKEEKHCQVDPRTAAYMDSEILKDRIQGDRNSVLNRKPSETELICHSTSAPSAGTADNLAVKYESSTRRARTKSALRRLSPANIKIQSTRVITKLRKPQWRKHCLAIFNMITIYIVAWICWSPLWLQYFIDIRGQRPAYTYKIMITILYLNPAFNVILYAMMNNTHRRAYKKLLCKCFGKT